METGGAGRPLGDALPYEVVLVIISYLNLKDTYRFCQCNDKNYKLFRHDEKFWEKKILREHPYLKSRINILNINDKSWYNLASLICNDLIKSLYGTIESNNIIHVDRIIRSNGLFKVQFGYSKLKTILYMKKEDTVLNILEYIYHDYPFLKKESLTFVFILGSNGIKTFDYIYKDLYMDKDLNNKITHIYDYYSHDKSIWKDATEIKVYPTFNINQ